MRAARLCLVLIICLAASGCTYGSAPQSLVGRWGGDVTASDGRHPSHARFTVTFASNGTWSGTERIDRVPTPQRFTGTWKLQPDGRTVDILRSSGTGMGTEGTLSGNRLVTRQGGSPSVLTRLHWWQLR